MTPKPDSSVDHNAARLTAASTSTALRPDFLPLCYSGVSSGPGARWFLPTRFENPDQKRAAFANSSSFSTSTATTTTSVDETPDTPSTPTNEEDEQASPQEDRHIGKTVLHPPGVHGKSRRHRSDYHPHSARIFRIGVDQKTGDLASPSYAKFTDSPNRSPQFPKRHGSTNSDGGSVEEGDEDFKPNARLFPSMRLLVAVLLCCCYITISISTSNLAVGLICMINCPLHDYAGDLEWQSSQEGLVLAAQNAGSLLMLLTGLYADRVDGKLMVGLSLVLCTIGNLLLPALAAQSFWYAVIARLAIGASDACMSPAVNSLITRWFPRSERAAAIGIITGGRQIGTLFILPTAGYLCTRTDLQGGWRSIFLLSGLISALVVIFWLPIGADKPAKQYCISNRERLFIESRIACESIGKRTHARRIPWHNVVRSAPLWAGVFSLTCHEFPLVVMLQFLPNYMRDVLDFSPTQNGMLSALPIFFLFASKTLSASLSSVLSRRSGFGHTRLCKIFNAVGSAGLALSIVCVPQFDRDSATWAIIALCFAMAFAGLHTPGVQTALLQLAPPFSGVITGISFFAVAWSSIFNKLLTKWIVREGTRDEWALVFYSSAVVAALPVFVFSRWGSDERQSWAMPSSKASVTNLASASLRTNLSPPSSIRRKDP